MKKILMVVVIVIMIQGIACYDFRGNNWGDSKQDVINVEGEENIYINDGDILAYSVTIANKKATLAYIFVNDILVRSKYLFKEDHSQKSLHILDFREISGLIVEKYGKSKSKDIVWLDDLYKDDPSYWGLAISMGKLSMQEIWENENTEIILTLTGDNYEITHYIQYASLKHMNLENEYLDNKSKEGL